MVVGTEGNKENAPMEAVVAQGIRRENNQKIWEGDMEDSIWMVVGERRFSYPCYISSTAGRFVGDGYTDRTVYVR